MGTLTDFAELELLDHVFSAAYATGGTVYVGLSTGTPSDDDSGWAELAYTAYTRQAVAWTVGSRILTQNGALSFPQKDDGADETIIAYGIFDAVSGGNALAYGTVSPGKLISVGSTPQIATAAVTVSMTAGAVSTYLADKLLGLMFDATAYPTPNATLAVALLNTEAVDGDTDLTAKEPSGNNYSRKAFTDWQVAAAGAVDNNTIITFATPSAAWGAISGIAVCDAAATGNMLFYDNSPTGDGQNPGNGDTVQIAAEAFDVTLD